MAPGKRYSCSLSDRNKPFAWQWTNKIYENVEGKAKVWIHNTPTEYFTLISRIIWRYDLNAGYS